jgi:DNA helicase II / ATP-dependent DNA helicase PcrA
MPLTYSEFQECVQASVAKFSSNWLNCEQDAAVSAQASVPVFIVAGPGTGKTTVLALRVLRHIFVDDFSPESIIATTFTRKAASELRSRILSWGVVTQEQALQRALATGDAIREQWLRSLDINKVQTGTLDSLCEDMLANDRQPGEITPTVVEKFMAKGLLRKHVMFANGLHRNPDLQSHLSIFNRQFPGVTAFASKLKVSHAFADRVLHDGVDLTAYSTQGSGHQILTELVNLYHQHLVSSQLIDFALLEKTILNRLRDNRLSSTTQNLRALLVDEFQDTNYLQEQIYYELCRNSNASLTVVGDDDQSIYRFRGATVEIFANFENRIQNELGINWNPHRVDLINNYRSSQRIVEFCNHFIVAESNFLSARAPGKSACVAASTWATDPQENVPVLGLFRQTADELANDLCGLLHNVFRGNGHRIEISGGNYINVQGGVHGDFGDAVLLSPKVRETTEAGRDRLPLFIRNLLGDEQVFNPRGRDLAVIPEVGRCLGLMLECIDPGNRVQNSIATIKPGTSDRLNNWRQAGRQFVQTNPDPGGLQQFIEDWGRRHAPRMAQWPGEWPILELLFTVITWFPSLQRTPEGQVYLEAISRVIAEASQVSSFRSTIRCGTAYDDSSVRDAIREIFEPIAEGEADVDEEIMPYVPKSVFPIMTIHQAKGLEFPLVIVDVGSDYKINHAAQHAFRYPSEGADVHLTEDELALYSPVGSTRRSRDRRIRAFDDLRRLFFVAGSRPQRVLLLVGLTSQLTFDQRKRSYKILSVATGDLMDGSRSLDFISSKDWSPASSSNTVALI